MSRRREDPRRIPPRARFRELRRLAWYKLTRRMPRYDGEPEQGEPLAFDERCVFARIVTAEKRRQPYAAEPQRRRKP